MVQRRIKQIINLSVSYIFKWLVDIRLIKIQALGSSKTASDLIVSLTSYGRRVNSEIVYYTIVSLLNQTMQPKMIVLWLDYDHWNNDCLPPKLFQLIKKGVTIKYCQDMKSYKKLIPSLKAFSNCTILTVDDDVIYPKDFVEVLYNAHEQYPTRVICGRGAVITTDMTGCICNYVDWQDADSWKEYKYLVPIGVGGILYPPKSLHEDACRDDLFMRFAPNADDLWFWVMQYLNGTRQMVVQPRGHYLSFDALYQFFHKGSALTHSNAKQGMNDVQLKQILDYYSIEL